MKTPLPHTQGSHTPAGAAGSLIDADVRARIERVLDLIRPSVRSDGGDLELVDVTVDGVVQIRLHGACVGCPSSSVTLAVGIERNLKLHVPQVTAVRAVE